MSNTHSFSEAATHERTFMQWPSRTSIHGADLPAMQHTIAQIANTIARFEPVVMLVTPRSLRSAKRILPSDIGLWPLPVDDLWCRDSGPTFISVDGRLAIADLNFNGWGGKQIHDRDCRVAGRVAARLQVPVVNYGVVGEAGGLECDGEGTALAHESSWLNPNRNTLSKSQVETLMARTLGLERIIWAPGISGEDVTDGHIDAVARFVEPGHVLVQMPRKADPRDQFDSAAAQIYEILKSARDAHGRKFQISVVHNPDYEKIRSRSRQFVASYVNYAVINGAVLVAAFGDDRADSDAQQLLSDLYPCRTIIPLNVDALGRAGGGIHCATNHQPTLRRA